MNIKPIGRVVEETCSQHQNERVFIDPTRHSQMKLAGVMQVILQSLITVKIPLISSFTVAFFGMMTGEGGIAHN